MTRELVSRRTRNGFREFLVGWTLREIELEFDGANISRDRGFQPDVSGQRRSLVEQYYRTLDFSTTADVRRLLSAYQSIVERAERNLPTAQSQHDATRAIAQLKDFLAKDGFAYGAGRLIATTVEARAVFEQLPSVSEVTRRAIFTEFERFFWAGQLEEPEFLERICEPSNSGHQSAIIGAWQHRVRNLDWDGDWVFQHKSLDLLCCSDEFLLRFLCETVHPAVRRESAEAQALVAALNSHLRIDGWELMTGQPISGRPTFVARRRATGAVSLPEPVQAKDVLADEYVRELAGKCDTKLATRDYDGAITNARTMIEAVLVALEEQLTDAPGDYKGDLPKQFKAVAKQLRIDDERTDLDDNFKQVARGLVQVVNGLAPIRNKMSDGHARERKPEAHHARVIVNAAKTVATFLVESYLAQRERGRLSASSKSEAAR